MISGTPMKRHSLLVFIVAYYAEKTIEQVIRRIPSALVQDYNVEILVIDDGSQDDTFAKGAKVSQVGLPFRITCLHNPVNQGYGGNQKIGFHYAIEKGFDFVALLHGDGQYAPEVLPTLVEPLHAGEADVVFGSRMMPPSHALKGGMPLYKFVGNRILTKAQNWLLGTHLSEFHSGYRVYSVEALKAVPFDRNSNVFHFDTEIIIQMVFAGRRIREIPIPTYYGDEISYVNGVKYAKDVIKASLQARLQSVNVLYDRRFDCAAGDNHGKYPSKLDFDSTHSRVVELIPNGSRVLDIGSGFGSVGAALKDKDCYIVGCDMVQAPVVSRFDRFLVANLDEGVPDFGDERFDYIIALDVIEHLRTPEDFLDQLRVLAARSPDTRVIITTANIGFFLMRILLLLGRFEYGKRGILDLTHTRLLTMATLGRMLAAAGFDIKMAEGVVVPLPFILGKSRLARWLMAVNKFLVRLRPELFGFQLLVMAKARPMLATLLADAEAAAIEKSEKLDRGIPIRAA
jgi:glycosyltransferase involved in cell wall biosynthesis